MSEITTIRRGHNTFVVEAAPNADRGDRKNLNLRSSAGQNRRALVYFPLTGIAGRTIIAATLTGHAAGTWAAQTITVQRLSASFAAKTATWNNQPGVTGTTATVATGALTDGAEFSLTVTAIIQAVASGAKWYGLRVSTNASTQQSVYGFESGKASWTLTIELSDVPEKPSLLTPAGAGVVSRTKPVLSWDFTDFGGSTEQAAFQVQIDPAANGTTPAFDTGTVAGTEPEYDSSSGAYAGFSTAGGTTQWRVRVQDGDGNWSDWSDWAMWTYRAKPTLTMDSPVGTTLSDTSPTILAHISTANLKQWRIRVADGTDRTRIRYDSGVQAGSGTNIAHTVPFKAPEGITVFNGQTNYWLNVQAWDTYARVSTPLDTTYVETWVLVTQVSSGTAPVLSTVTQVGTKPQLQFVWTAGAAPDNWLVLRDGLPYARLDPADVTSGGGTYTWNDPSYTEGWTSHIWTVKAITASVQSAASNTKTTSLKVTGTWLITQAGQVVVLGGTDVNWQQLDRSAVYKPVGIGTSVVVVDGQEGFSGSYTGELSDQPEHTRAQALATLQAMKDDPTATVWLVASDVAIPVTLMNLSYPPDGEALPSRLMNRVSFSFEQADLIPYGVG